MIAPANTPPGHRRTRRAWKGFILAAACAASLAEVAFATSTPPAILRAEYHGIDWMPGDCAYHATTMGSDGKVYFAVSTHVVGESARLFSYDPVTARVRLMCGMDQLIPDTGTVTQGKIHAPITEWNGEFYTCTHTAWYFHSMDDPISGRVQKPYPGGYVVAVNMQSGAGRVVAEVLHHHPVTAAVGPEQVPMDGEGLITNVLDPARGIMYVNSWPSSILMKVDLATEASTELARIQDDGETVARGTPGYGQCPRTLALDEVGNLYWSNSKGEIWRYDPDSGLKTIMQSRMEEATRISLPNGAEYLNMWRTIVWDARTRAFYGVHWGTSWLFKYDPNADRMEALGAWRSDAMRDAPANTDFAQLGLSLGPAGRLYGFVHAPPAKPALINSVHLLAYDMDHRTIKDHGEIRNSNGNSMIYAESCAVSEGGDVYTVGWIEAPPSELDTVKLMRRQGPGETLYHPYLIALVKVPAFELADQDTPSATSDSRKIQAHSPFSISPPPDLRNRRPAHP